MQEEQENSVSLGEIGRFILKRIWYVLGISVLAAIIAAVVFHFAINPATARYTMDFRLVYPASAAEKYPDGSPFYYQDMISEENLRAAKESDPAFSSVNTEKMFREDDITVTAETETIGGVKSYTGRYTVTVKGSYFKSETAAKDFIVALANVTVSNIVSNAGNIDYRIDQDIFSQASFEERLKLLKAQKEMLLEKYNGWIEIYHETYSVNGKTLANYLSDVTVVCGESTQEGLEDAFKTNGYDGLDLNTYNGDLNAAIDARAEQLRSEKALNDAIIGKLQAEIGTNPPADYASVLSPYVERNIQIEYQLNTTLTVENVQAFSEKLDSQYAALETAAQTAKTVTGAIYERETSARFDTQTANESGSTSTVFVAIGTFIIAFIVCTVASYLVVSSRNRRAAQSNGDAQSNGEEKDPAQNSQENGD